MLGRISRPFLRSVVRPLNQARFFHRPSPYRVLNPTPLYLTKIPRIRVVATDGAGTSGDFRNKRVIEAMQTSTENHFESVGCPLHKKFLDQDALNWFIGMGKEFPPIYYLIVNDLGLAKDRHLKIIVQMLQKLYFNVRTRYNFDSDLLENDVNKIHEKLQTEGVNIIANSTPVLGFKEVATMLKNEEIELVLQTAYGTKEAEAFRRGMSRGGVTFKECITSNHVKHPRPFPAKLDKIKDLFGVNEWEMAVLGDTINDFKGLRNFWRIAVPWTSSLFRSTPSMTLAEEERETKRVAKILIEAGAQYVLDQPYRKIPMHIQLKSVIDDINNKRMALNDFGDNKTVELIPELLTNAPNLARK